MQIKLVVVVVVVGSINHTGYCKNAKERVEIARQRRDIHFKDFGLFS